MAGVTAKRFWSDVSIAQAEAEQGFTIYLDDKALKTPAKAPFYVPTRVLAQAVAAEWSAQDALINPQTMPVTRSANAAIDKVSPQKQEVAAQIAAYGAHDLLCYRAEHPNELVERQNQAWGPLLVWATQALNAELQVGQGIMSVPQNPQTLERLAAIVQAHTAFELTALYDMVALSGSLIIGLAAQRGVFERKSLWDAAQVDENWQISQWGYDSQAAEQMQQKRDAFFHAAQFHQMLI